MYWLSCYPVQVEKYSLITKSTSGRIFQNFVTENPREFRYREVFKILKILSDIRVLTQKPVNSQQSRKSLIVGRKSRMKS